MIRNVKNKYDIQFWKQQNSNTHYVQKHLILEAKNKNNPYKNGFYE